MTATPCGKEGGGRGKKKNTSSYAEEVSEESGEKQHVGGLLKEGQRRSEGWGGKKRGQEMEPTSRLGDLASQNVPKYDNLFADTSGEAEEDGKEGRRLAGKSILGKKDGTDSVGRCDRNSG